MYSQNCLQSEKLVKTFIGWSGLLYFFITDNQAWGEAIGLTLFFASGQLQTAMKPPLDELFPKCVIKRIIPIDHLLEAWRITLGLASCLYYSYFELYLNVGLNFYISTICLSLLWESQIVDDLINVTSSWISRDMTIHLKICTKTASSLKHKTCKHFIRNIIQDFLCVLCKLFKHLIMNFYQMNNFSYLLTRAQSIAKECVNLPSTEKKQGATLEEKFADGTKEEVHLFVRVSFFANQESKSACKQRVRRYTRKSTVF